MSNQAPDALSVAQRIQRALQDARAQLQAYEEARTEPIAVIGMGCRFPGGADTPEKFWTLLHDGVDAVTPVPADRWDVKRYYDPRPATPGKMYFCRGGFVERVDCFDAAFFGISPREAMSMDPQHRLLLEVSWEALENAALAPDTLRHSRTGVFVGICQNDYARFELNASNPRVINAYSGTGTLSSFAPGRLAYVLGLQGPTMAVDTACSSSLVAVHLACNALRNKEADVALASGVHLILGPEMSVFLSMSRALAADGLAKTFDAAADGFTRGEGCGTVVLKRLSDARADGDRILAVLRGSAVNHDGPSSGLTVPNEEAQEQVIRQALQQARVAPGAIGYVEAHGTGTSLGDPIELAALVAALCQDRAADGPLLIGSVKTNCGHLEGAAGVISLIKVVLSMVYGEIPPHLHFHTPNPRIDWDNVPLLVPTQLTPWPADERRLAGISSFGMSGVNAHLVVESFPETTASTRPGGQATAAGQGTQLLALSAKSADALAAQVENFMAYLEAHPHLDIVDVCFTANTGRAHFAHRLGVLATSTAELSRKLHDYRNGHRPPGVFAGRHDGVSATVPDGSAPPSPGDPEALGRAYVHGAPIDWRAVYQAAPGRKVTLPTYPFQRQRYWVDMAAAHIDAESSLLGQRLHLPFSPERRFETRYTPQSPPYMAHHRVGGAVVVPAASHMAMVLAGVQAGWGTTACVIEETVFAQAMVLAPETARTVQLIFSPASEECFSFRIVSRQEGEAPGSVTTGEDAAWVSHVTGVVRLPASAAPLPESQPVDVAAVRARCTGPRPGQELYADLQQAGFDLGPAFQWGDSLWQRQDEVLCRLQGAIPLAEVSAYQLHPGLLDTCFQTLSVFWEVEARDLAATPDLYVPFRIARLVLHRCPVPGQPLWSHAALPAGQEPRRGAAATLRLCDEHGAVYVEVTGFEFRKTSRSAMAQNVATPTDDWLQEIAWVEDQALPPASAGIPQRWLLVADATDLAARTAQLLEQHGDTCILVAPAADSGRLRAHYQEVLAQSGPLHRIVHVQNLQITDPDEAIDGCESVLHLVQAIARVGWSPAPTLALVTRGVHALPAYPSTPAIAQAPIWGLARALHLEHPELACMLIDCPPAPADGRPPGDDAASLVQALRAAGQENQIALRGGRRYVPRLVRHQAPPAPSVSASSYPPAAGLLHDTGSYLITGGLGTLGLRVAQWMVAQGARHLVLIGRSAPAASALQDIRAMQAAGARVLPAAVDVAQQPALRALFETMRTTMPPLRGIIHAAGVVDDAIVLRQDRARLLNTFAPKVQGAWHLHQLSANLPLDFFITFSSTASLFGSRGQGNYAAANAFLDALAAYRRALGLVGLSINWGPWAGAGMAAEAEKRRQVNWTELGIDPLHPEHGLTLLGRLLRDQTAQVGVVRVNWRRFRTAFFGDAPPPFFAEWQGVAETQAPPAMSEGLPRLHLIEQLMAGRPAERRTRLHAYLRARVAQVLRSSPEAIAPRQGLFNAGLDSLMAIELKTMFAAELALVLPQTFVFDYPTVEAMVEFLLDKLGAETTPDAPPSSASEAPPPGSQAVDLETLLAAASQMTEHDIARGLAGSNVSSRRGDTTR